MTKTELRYETWEPELSPEALEHLEGLRKAVLPQLEVMRQLRKMLGLTQAEVAELLQMTQANVSKMEKRGAPSLGVLARMAEAKGKRLRLVLEEPDGKAEESILV